MSLKNYKLSCVALDEEHSEVRLTFFEYDVETLEDARKGVEEDPYRRKLMRKYDINWEVNSLDAVGCDELGNVYESEIPHELDIMIKQNEYLRELKEQRSRRFYESNTEQ